MRTGDARECDLLSFGFEVDVVFGCFVLGYPYRYCEIFCDLTLSLSSGNVVSEVANLLIKSLPIVEVIEGLEMVE